MPIAVVPFAQANSAKNAVVITQIIRQDLQNSGQFNPLVQRNMPEFPHVMTDINMNAWRGKGIDNVVTGHVKALAKQQYRIHYELISAYGNRSKGQNPRIIVQGQTLLSQTFTVPKKALRALAHHIADTIYQTLTGQRGIFSTKIAYVLVATNVQHKKTYRLQVADYDCDANR
ncbi:MAG: hypothetical protein JKY13_02235 [Gammaproteobacteria bacterium]|nr:hypothetical protein [Gammaproteobacteria bacterium]